MTAPVRRLAVPPVADRGPAARPNNPAPPSTTTPATTGWAAWLVAVDVRQEWLAHGLATEPANRSATEDSLARIYARIGRSRPDVVWTRSPRCVVVERPAVLRTEPVPGAWHGQVRPHRDGIEFRDGWRPRTTMSTVDPPR